MSLSLNIDSSKGDFDYRLVIKHASGVLIMLIKQITPIIEHLFPL